MLGPEAVAIKNRSEVKNKLSLLKSSLREKVGTSWGKRPRFSVTKRIWMVLGERISTK